MKYEFVCEINSVQFDPKRELENLGFFSLLHKKILLYYKRMDVFELIEARDVVRFRLTRSER